ncbi:glycosyltransferase [Microbacterium sp. NPDC089318]
MREFTGLTRHDARKANLSLYSRAAEMLLRGLLRKPLFGASRGPVFIGRRTRISNPSFIVHAGRLTIEDGVELQGLARHGISLGADVSIGAGASIRPSSYYGGEAGEGLRVGDRSSLASGCFVGCSGMVTIGDDVMLGPGVRIFSENHVFSELDVSIKAQGVERSFVNIGDDCWIGSGTTITAGVTIGTGVVVGAGSVVTSDLPDYSVAAGIPARVLRSRRDDKDSGPDMSDHAEHPHPADDSRRPSLVIAVPTFKRPERLVRTLQMIGSQVALAAVEHRLERAEILVVDNDPAQSAMAAVADSYDGVRARYVSETEPGIPAVRNRAIDESKDFDLLAFIDDDEIPLPGWISSLLETWFDTGRPAAVMGRVVSIFDPDADPWVLQSGLFHRPERTTGTELDAVATGNLLLDLHQVRRSGVRFDPRIGLGGGSDTLFSTSLRKQTGARLVWCNESVTEDTVEPERQTRAWALKRAFSHGNVAVLVPLFQEHRRWTRLLIRVKAVFSGFARILAGCIRHLVGRVVRSLGHEARGLRLAYRGAGMVSAAAGRAYFAYARSDAAA